MKSIFNRLLVLSIACSFFVACKKDEVKTVMTIGSPAVVTLSPSTLVLTDATSADSLETISWTKPDYGFGAAVDYTLYFAKAGTNFSGAQQVSMGSNVKFKLTGNYLNNLAISAGINAGTTGQLDIKLKSSLSDSISFFSDILTLTVTTYKTLYPALLIQGGNSWITPSTRTNGYELTSPNYDGKYEGYFKLPNADGYGGDAFKLISSTTGVVYGWASNPATDQNVSGGFFVNMAVGAGNLWLTPAPNFVKANVDISTLKLNYLPVQFYASGDFNGWSTTATPLNFDAATNTLKTAGTVHLTAGQKFAFTANNGWDLSYKVDADNKIIYAGPPAWAGNNINVPSTGDFTIILDLSGGDGSYTYKIQ